MGAINETDLGYKLDWFPAPISHNEGWIFIEGVGPWCFGDHGARDFEGAPCPCCGNVRSGKPEKPLPRNYYCAGCDKTGLDGRGIVFAGLPIGAYMNAEWVKEYPEEGQHRQAYAPDDSLAGGVEAKPVKVRRGLARSGRKAG